VIILDSIFIKLAELSSDSLGVFLQACLLWKEPNGAKSKLLFYHLGSFLLLMYYRWRAIWICEFFYKHQYL